MAMTLVSTVTVGAGGTTKIEFTNIPQTAKDFVCLLSIRIDDSGSFSGSIYPGFNGDGSGVNYPWRRLLGTGAAASSSNAASQNITLAVNAGGATANTFGNMQLYVSNYTSSTNKSWSIDSVTENNGSTAHQSIIAGQWTSSTGITSLSFDFVYNVLQYSTASLYLIS